MSKKAILNLKLSEQLSTSLSHKVDNDVALTENSDKLIPSQKAIKAYVDALPKPLTFKGVIDIPGDFPTSAEVTEGWFYQIGTDVTDDDGSKTNTGLSFTAGDEIA